MDVHAAGWIGLAAVIIALIVIDVVGHVRSPHEPTLKEATWWSVAYVALAIVFGGIVWWIWGSQYGGEYFAGYLTEKSLSVDNLFVFLLIMTSFKVPRKYQQEVLLAGIVIALVLRLIFILLGAAVIARFSWVFYIFGLFLLWTAFSQAREGTGDDKEDDEEYRPNAVVRWASKVFPVSNGFVGGKMIYRHAGKTFLTPLLLCIIAIGTADLMFAMDSIPAIYGLTAEPYIVFAANAFSLLGLRQLYFLLDGLLDRLIYLHYGLAAILGFIGAKLIIHALHENTLPFLNDGQGIHSVPEPSIAISLLVILGVMVITVTASLLRSRRDDRARAARASASSDVENN